MQQHSWHVFDAWLATWLSREHPLADTIHEHWFDAPTLDIRGNRAREIVRQEWPTELSNASLVRDYALFIRQYGRAERPLNEMQIGAALIKRGLRALDTVRSRLPVKYFDERKRANVTTYISVYSAPDKELIQEFLFRRYGLVPETPGEIAKLKMSNVETAEF